MDAILKTLFIALDEQQERSPEENAALKGAEPVLQAAQNTLGRKEFDRVW